MDHHLRPSLCAGQQCKIRCAKRVDSCACNIISIYFNPVFSEPQFNWSRASPCPPLANHGARGARQELLLGKDEAPAPVRKSFQHLYNSNEPETKTVVPRVDTAPHDVETSTWVRRASDTRKRVRKRWSPGSIPPRTNVEPKPGVCRPSATINRGRTR